MEEQTKQLTKLLSRIKQPLLPELPGQEQPTTPRIASDGNSGASPLVESLMLEYPNLTQEQIESLLQEM